MVVEITTFTTVIVAVLSLVIAFATWVSKSKQDYGKQDAHNASVLTKLDFISEDVKDVKADQRSFRQEINEVRNIATHASERAEAAHNRLDRLCAEEEENV